MALMHNGQIGGARVTRRLRQEVPDDFMFANDSTTTLSSYSHDTCRRRVTREADVAEGLHLAAAFTGTSRVICQPLCNG